MKMNSKRSLGICGVDEAGRGAWAGPVVAAAVMLAQPIDGLTDSKTISADKRTTLAKTIQAQSIWAIGVMNAAVIDEMNILQATMRAMTLAVDTLGDTPSHVLVDGNRLPDMLYPATAVVRGDTFEPSIQAASILAKVARDCLCGLLDVHYPNYGFAKHKGYGTQAHRNALATLGVSPVHRKSYKPVAAFLQ